MPTKKILVVFGATGAQGGSVIESILGDVQAAQLFALRAVTRDPDSANAKQLAAKGVECVKGDANHKDDLRIVLEGAYAVFAVTNYYASGDPEVELQQGKNIADAAKEARVQHLVWSSLLHTTELTKGKFPHIYHFDSKADVERYIRSLGIPATYFLPGFYMQNLAIGFLHPNPNSDTQEWVLTMPCPARTPIPLFDAAEDTGKFVKAILLNRDATLAKRVLGAVDYYTCAQIVEQFAEMKPEAGRNARFVEVSPNEFKSFVGDLMGVDDRIQLELLENMQFMTEFGYFGKASLEQSQSILNEKSVK